ncbi:MAG: YraN family protein [Gammaproteobacteria bacterium]|jgi:putative endonuclease
MRSLQKGLDAETLACEYLLGQGLVLVERNFRSRHGEIDLVMHERDSLVFVEVRYRRESRYGSGAESIDRRKQARITACARYFIQCNPRTAERPCRFDVMAVSGNLLQPQIEWIRDAFPGAG